MKIPESVKQAARVLEESGETSWQIDAGEWSIDRYIYGFCVWRDFKRWRAPTLAEAIAKAEAAS